MRCTGLESSRPYIGYVLRYPRASAHTCSFPVAPPSSAHQVSSISTVALQVSLMLTLVSYSRRTSQAPPLALFAAVTKSSRPGDMIKNRSLFPLLFWMPNAQSTDGPGSEMDSPYVYHFTVGDTSGKKDDIMK